MHSSAMATHSVIQAGPKLRAHGVSVISEYKPSISKCNKMLLHSSRSVSAAANATLPTAAQEFLGMHEVH
eukprot:5346313-Amphidinium_carterae.2